MDEDDARFGDPDFEQVVREIAYLLWERDGRPEGGEKHYWYLALAKCMRQHEEDERAQRGLIDPM
ncbi:MAG TPA: DUF2934 domain-containing protein [Devosia sp.]|jgi:hypothetical protein